MSRHLRRAMCMGAMALGLMAASAEAQLVSFDVGVAASGCETATSAIDANVSNPQLCRGPGVTAGTVTNGFTGSGFTEVDEAAAITAGDYFSASVTVNSGFVADISDLVIVTRRSGTGPQSLSLRSSADGFATTIGTAMLLANTSDQTFTFNFPDINDAAGTVEFRLYIWGSTNPAGTFRLTDTTAGTPSLTINGTTQPGMGANNACCLPNGTCMVLSATDCANQSGIFQSGMTTCTGVSCSSFAACCLVDGTCQVLNETTCTSQGGTVQTGMFTCAGVSCPQPLGACCINGNCLDATMADCASAGGTFTAGMNCGQITCQPPTGACCLAMGNCMILTQADCTTQSGTWTASANATCGPSDCPQTGACCVGTTCTIDTFANCDAMTGIWLGRNVACGAGTCVVPANPANVVAQYNFDLLRQGTLVLTTTGSMPFPLGDAFNPSQRFRAVPEPVAFTLLDDSTFFNDNLGVIEVVKVDTFFGVTDVQGVIEPGTTDSAEAEFTFDISGRSGLSLSVDLAAMGDFETALGCSMPPCTGDIFSFSAQIDGGAEQLLLQATADEAAMLTYTLENGSMVELPDPLVVDGTTTLNNEFSTFTRPITGTGSSLKIIFRAQTDGSEAFVFDNVVIMGVTGTATGACELPGGSCDIRTEDLCDLAGGTYLGDNTECVSDCDIADFDGSGTVDATDIFIFLDAWFAQNGMSGPNLSADVDGSGTVDATDIFIYLDFWFAQNGMTC